MTLPVSTCYRHQSREANVRCVRCDRPICPSCMRDASVGFQCPECIAEGRRTVRAPRTAFGGSLTGTLGRVTMVLIGLNAIGLILELVLGSPAAFLDGIFSALSRIHLIGAVYGPDVYIGPDGRGYTGPVEGSTLFPGVDSGTGAYRLLTAMFIHYGPLHFLMNMYLLWWLGRQLEADLGPVRYLLLYLLCGIGGDVAAYLFSPGTFTAGASGAVFGLFAAQFIVFRRLNRDTTYLAMLILFNLIFTFSYKSISVAGHLGGLAIGGILGLCLAYAPRENRTLLHGAAFAVVALGLAGLTGLAIAL